MTQKPTNRHARDGLVRMPELLMEAICCAPFSGAEARIVWFIARRIFTLTEGQRAQKHSAE